MSDKTEHIVLDWPRIDSMIYHQAGLIDEALSKYRIQKYYAYPVMKGAMYYGPQLLRNLWTINQERQIEVIDYLGEIDTKHPVLVMDTIYDTGETSKNIAELGYSMMFAFLIRKERVPSFEDCWVGEQVPEEYVYGYGLDDLNGHRRELPYIAYESEDHTHIHHP